MVQTKPWWMSKAMWASVLIAGIAILQALGYTVPVEVLLLLNALGLAGVRLANGVVLTK